MEDLIPSPLKDFTPRANPPRASTAIESSGIDDATLATLDQMDAEGLRALIRLICGARWGEVALMTEDEAYDAVCLKMLHGGLTQSDIAKALPALNGWADRRKGKPGQSVTLDATIKSVTVNATIKFADVPQHVVIEGDATEPKLIT